jgi:hypothetical protein
VLLARSFKVVSSCGLSRGPTLLGAERREEARGHWHVQLATLYLQNFRDADANLFAPVHRLLYFVSGVTGPIVPVPVPAPVPVARHISNGSDAYALTEMEKEKEFESERQALLQRLTAERWLNRVKIALCVLGCMGIIARHVPPTALPPGGYLEVGDTGLAHCVWMQSFRDCSPLRLKLSSGGRDSGSGEGWNGGCRRAVDRPDQTRGRGQSVSGLLVVDVELDRCH